MRTKKEDQVMVNEHVLEVRFRPSGTFVDKRGLIADYIVEKGQFSYWRIETNVVNFQDMEGGIKRVGGFVSFRNVGYVAYDPQTKNFFEDKAISFWKDFLSNPHFDLPLITRFGLRTKTFITSNSNFESLESKMFSKFFRTDVEDIVGGKRSDLQIVFDLSEDNFKSRLLLGPLHKDEANRHFSFSSEHFKATGTYIDCDIYQEKTVNQSEVPLLVKKAMELVWQKIDLISQALEL